MQFVVCGVHVVMLVLVSVAFCGVLWNDCVWCVWDGGVCVTYGMAVCGLVCVAYGTAVCVWLSVCGLWNGSV